MKNLKKILFCVALLLNLGLIFISCDALKDDDGCPSAEDAGCTILLVAMVFLTNILATLSAKPELTEKLSQSIATKMEFAMDTHFLAIVIKKNIINYTIVTLFAFFAGMLFCQKEKVVYFIRSKMNYTKGTAQKLYKQWDKSKMFFYSDSDDSKSFTEFEAENKTYALYFWATWCPHCVNVFETVAASSKNISFASLPFETNEDSYLAYKREHDDYLWQDLVLNENGKQKFIPREKEFNVPLIPSVWLIKNGKVKKVFIGERGIKKFSLYLANSHFEY